MNLITLSFEVPEEDHVDFIRKMEDMKDYWDVKGFVFSQFRDTSRKNRFLQLFLTEKSVDHFTALIQNDSKAKAMFEAVKKVAGHVVVSCMECVI
jgi:hypothetical protein